MSVVRHPTLRCDFPTGERGEICGEWADVQGWDSYEIRANAKQLSWQTNAPGGKDFCPKHRKTTPRNQGAPTA